MQVNGRVSRNIKLHETSNFETKSANLAKREKYREKREKIRAGAARRMGDLCVDLLPEIGIY